MRLAVPVRRLHKWLALVVGAQALIWTLTGLYMTAISIDVIHGDHFIRTLEARAFDLAPLAETGPIVEAVPGAAAVRLTRLLGRPVYVVERAGRQALFDAVSGARLAPPTEATIRAVARSRYTGVEPIARVERLDNVPAEIRGRAAPVWRVEFDHWNRPTLYLSPETGELLTRRHELWRVFDIAWMLHIMDYEARENINNPLLRAATLAAALMTLTGAALLIWSFPGRRRRRIGPLRLPRLSPLFFRRVHKWVGLVVGVQLVLWAVSGAGMALLDHDAVMGHGAEHAASTVTLDAGVAPPAALASALGGSVTGLELRTLHDRPVYEATTPAGVRLVDARTALPLVVDARLARDVAAHGTTDNPVRAVAHLPTPTLEARGHAGPVWRVDFTDADNTTVYVAEDTGRVVAHRTDTWRLFDLLWMLHTMGYAGEDRDDFNHPLIVAVAFGVLWLAGTGVYLLFKSAWRPDLRWLTERRRGATEHG